MDKIFGLINSADSLRITFNLHFTPKGHSTKLSLVVKTLEKEKWFIRLYKAVEQWLPNRVTVGDFGF